MLKRPVNVLPIEPIIVRAALGKRDALRCIVSDVSPIGRRRLLATGMLVFINATPHRVALLALYAIMKCMLTKNAVKSIRSRAHAAAALMHDDDRAALIDTLSAAPLSCAASAVETLAMAGALPPSGDALRQRLINACVEDPETAAITLEHAALFDQSERALLIASAARRARSAAQALITLARIPMASEDQNCRAWLVDAIASDPIAATKVIGSHLVLAPNERSALLDAIRRLPYAASRLLCSIDSASLHDHEMQTLIGSAQTDPMSAAIALESIVRIDWRPHDDDRQRLVNISLSTPSSAAYALYAAALMSDQELSLAIETASSNPMSASSALRALSKSGRLAEVCDEQRIALIRVIARDAYAAANALYAAHDLNADDRASLLAVTSRLPMAAASAMCALGEAIYDVDDHLRSNLIASVANDPYAAAHALGAARFLQARERTMLVVAALHDPFAAASAVTQVFEQQAQSVTPNWHMLVHTSAHNPYTAAIVLESAWSFLSNAHRVFLIHAIVDPYALVDLIAKLNASHVYDSLRATLIQRAFGEQWNHLIASMQERDDMPAWWLDLRRQYAVPPSGFPHSSPVEEFML